VCGRAQTVGSGVDSIAVGDRVCTLSLAGGGFSTHRVAPADSVVRLPVGLAAELAAAGVENYSSMAFAVAERVVVRPAEWVLLLGAGGGIRLAAVDVVRAVGDRGRVKRGETSRGPSALVLRSSLTTAISRTRFAN